MLNKRVAAPEEEGLPRAPDSGIEAARLFGENMPLSHNQYCRMRLRRKQSNAERQMVAARGGIRRLMPQRSRE